MPASPTPDAPARRVAILAGTGRYDHPEEWEELGQVETALATVAGCLDGLGYRSGGNRQLPAEPDEG